MISCPVCAKTIFSCVRKVLSIAKAHLFLGIIQGTVVSAALATHVSLVSILQVCDCVRVSAAGRHYFSTYIIIKDWHQD